MGLVFARSAAVLAGRCRGCNRCRTRCRAHRVPVCLERLRRGGEKSWLAYEKKTFLPLECAFCNILRRTLHAFQRKPRKSSGHRHRGHPVALVQLGGRCVDGGHAKQSALFRHGAAHYQNLFEAGYWLLCLSTRYTVCRLSWRNICIPRWKTTVSIS